MEFEPEKVELIRKMIDNMASPSNEEEDITRILESKEERIEDLKKLDDCLSSGVFMIEDSGLIDQDQIKYLRIGIYRLFLDTKRVTDAYKQ